MKNSTYIPDALPPGVRSISYGIFCWANRHPGALRAIGKVLRRWPFVGGWLGMPARASAVKAVLTRPNSFSNTAHAANLSAGDYLIGMDPGPTYSADKILLDDRLAILKETLPAAADKAVQDYVEALGRLGTNKSFDLIEDYLMWIVFRAMYPLFGAATDRVAAGAGGSLTDPGLKRQYLLEIRYVAGQLLAGSSATLRVQRRAELNADALMSRIAGVRTDIQSAWGLPGPDNIERNAVGLAWISHPVTVQSGALAVQELLDRPKVHKALRDEARRLKQLDPDAVWQNADFRERVRNHVLELLRFRPIFPLLARDVPRDTEFETGARHNATCPAGGKMAIWSIAALFDSDVVKDSNKFCPARDWGKDEDLRWLMFGYGTRQCPAMVYAVEILTSALIGLLILPELQLAKSEGKAITYDGPLMSRMRVSFV
ncbi:cytochrome P450 [Bradyrhizobium sp. CB82]|uniref:cytochrome P450 n=1 Tax=Bradyrhizobium sp. CB82 TaxID=3039159 RepID=UPI0024B1029A|nr:cytochrome P450 [Bradyrhizobium sp. CB82]WFU37903.1 cytochrome P450 [Bradyrhizobium sp. CB82]